MIRKGTYVLFVVLSREIEVDIGSLGLCHFDPGTYCYVGSAMGGIDQRVRRHLSDNKKIRWHIDRLTLISDHKEAYESYPDFVPECELAYIAERCGAMPAIKGFGCSDCSCMTHLFMVTDEVKDRLILEAGLVPFK
ncbi:MAG: GIY-YIG nuclease family protein [Candidatus Methanogranum gryphiswaldense]|nr:MAG: GIY-YIG nuclease family protein [Candidatus Methanogranum sp. U3.2.1]